MEYCLHMPASAFFLMLNEARKLRAYEYVEACDIAMIPACNSKYFEVVRRRHERVLDLDPPKAKTVDDSLPIRPVVDAASDEAKYLMMAFFASGKRSVH